jgi:hypothetical protein
MELGTSVQHRPRGLEVKQKLEKLTENASSNNIVF